MVLAESFSHPVAGFRRTWVSVEGQEGERVFDGVDAPLQAGSWAKPRCAGVHAIQPVDTPPPPRRPVSR